MDNCMLFSGRSHPDLAKEIAEKLGVKLGKVKIEQFPDNEIGVQIEENVRGRDVYVVQSVARHPNLYLTELLILIDALKRSSAQSIVAVIPYYGYARQDRKDKGRVPITAKLVANLLEKAGATRVLTMDLHTDQIQGFFDIPLDNLPALPTLAKAVAEEGISEPIVVSPDVGSIRMAREYATALKTEFAIVDKRRVSASEVEAGAVIGNVKGRDVVLVDDICSTGGTLKAAARACKAQGARRVVAAVSHGLFLGEMDPGEELEIVLTTNSVPPVEKRDFAKHISVAAVFADAIRSIQDGTSLSSLFKM